MMRIPRILHSLLPAWVLSLIWAGATCTPATAQDALGRLPGASRTIDYAQDVKPILEARCYTCHGPKKQKAAVFASTSRRRPCGAAATASRPSGPAVGPRASWSGASRASTQTSGCPRREID